MFKSMTGRSIAFMFCMAFLCLGCDNIKFWHWPESKKPKIKYEELVQNNIALQNKLEAAEKKYKSSENEKSIFLNNIKKILREKDDIIQAARELQAAQAQDPKFKIRLNEINKKLDAALKEKERLTKELNKTKDKTEEKLASLDKTIANKVDKEVKKFEKDKLKAFESGKAKLYSQIQNLKTALAKEAKQSDQRAAKLDSGFQEEKAKLQRDITKSKSALNREALGSGKTINELNSEIAKLAKEKEGLQGNIAQIKSAFDKEVLSSDRKIGELNTGVARLTKDRDSLIKERIKQRDILSRQAENFKKQVLDLGAEKSKLQAQLAKLGNNAKDLSMEEIAAARENEAYASSNIALREKNKELLQKIDILEQEKQKVTSEASNLKQNIKTSQRIEDGTDKRYVDLKRQTEKERLDMHYNLALVFQKVGQYRDAEREYLKALAINALDAGVHYNLGILYDDYLKDLEKAIYHYKQYLEINPGGQYANKVKEWILQAEEKIRLGIKTGVSKD